MGILLSDNVLWTIVVVSLVVARSRSANLPKWDRKRNSPSTMCAIVMLGNVILKEYILSPPPLHPFILRITPLFVELGTLYGSVSVFVSRDVSTLSTAFVILGGTVLISCVKYFVTKFDLKPSQLS